MKIFRYLLLLCLLSNNYIHAQDLTFKKYNIADGLPQIQVMRLFQDSRGFLWVVTKYGIAQFDGIDFINYTKKDGLPDNVIYDIKEDPNGILWAVSRSGISKFDGKKFIFYPPNSLNGKVRFSFPIIFSENCIWLLNKYKNKRELICFQNGNYKNFSSEYQELDSLRIHELSYDSTKKSVIISTKDKFYSWKNNSLKRLKLDKEDEALAREKIHITNEVSLLKFKNKIIDPDYVLRKNGKIILCNKKAVSQLNWDHEYFNGCLMDRDSVLWIKSEGGLFRFWTEAFINFTEQKNGLNKNIWSVVEDDNNNIWFASFTKGLQMYDGEEIHDKNEIFKIRKTPLYMGSKKLSNGDIFFTTGSGVIKWDGKSFSNVSWIDKPTEIIYENPIDKSILVGTTRALIYKKNGKIEYFKNLKAELEGYVMGISYDKRGFYWLVTNKSVLRFDGNKFYFFNQEEIPIKGGFATDVDSTGNIWLGGFEGLFYYSYEKDSFTKVLPDDIKSVVKFIKVMDKNRILVGRIKDLIIIDLKKLYNNNENYYKILNENDGYLGLECRQNGILKDSRGYYWINTTNSVVRFNPDKLKKNLKPPIVHFKSVKVQNDSLQWNIKKIINNYDKFQTDTIFLNHKENSIRIYYTGISTKNPKGVMYKYKLIGLHDNFSSPVKDRMIEFQNLKPGKYNFELIAANSDAVWTDKPEILVIIVNPTFRQTIIFKILVLVVFTILVTYSTYYFTKLKARKKEIIKKRQMYYTKLQMNQVIKQFDPHFTLNAVSSIGAYIMLGDREAAYNYLIKLSHLLRSVLENHEMFTKTIEEEIQFLINYCEIQKLRKNDKFLYSIHIDDSVDKNYKIPKMLLQSFVENAIKHGIDPKPDGGKVEIRFEQNNKEIIATIKDNGIGRVAAQKKQTSGTQKGQKITNELFTLINELTKKEIRYKIIDHHDENDQATGTEVKIFFPL